jgi:putative transposase
MGFIVNIKRVRRIRNKLKLYTIYPKPNLSKAKKEHKKYPYLLKDLKIERVNQVWSTDITYIKVKNKGWIYLVAIIDWYSRYIISHEISITMEVDFCINALNKALKIATPDIFNTDQGSQFTSHNFLEILEEREIKISMDSKGRALDNIRCERFWRSLKYEEVFLTEYNFVKDAKVSIRNYIPFYNNERIHQSLNYYTPYEIHNGKENLNVKKW